MAKSAFRNDWTAAQLRSHLTYNPETGEFWTTPRKIGTLQRFGKTRTPAWTISLKTGRGIYRTYYAHRLAWLWMTGKWPKAEIDHINNDSTDNRWENLREASHLENNRNKDFRKRFKKPLVGAHFHKPSGLWQAQIRHKTIGYFKTAEEAHEAYKQAALKAYGKFAHTSLTEVGSSGDPTDEDSR